MSNADWSYFKYATKMICIYFGIILIADTIIKIL